MTIRHLKIYLAVCEAGTLTEAGRKLYIAQPAVSLAISELETHYGVKFFDRISNRLHITDSGTQFLQYATHLIALYDEMEYNVSNSDGRGSLRIGSSITIANHYLCDFIVELQRMHPHLEVNVTIQNSKYIEEAVLNNKIDIGLVEGRSYSKQLIKKQFREDLLTFICPVSHPFATKTNIEISELNGQKFLLREEGSGGREIFDGLVDMYSLSIHKIWESTSTQAIIRGVASGFGVAILPYYLVKESINANCVSTFSLANISLKRDFSVIYHKNKFLSKSALDFLQLCE